MNTLHLRKLSAYVCLSVCLILSGCHKKHPVAPPPPPPPPPAAPTATIAVRPVAIDAGQSATVTWQTSNATDVSISGIGAVSVSGSQAVSPAASTSYTLTARGAGGSVEETARLTVNLPTPKPAPEQPSMSNEQLFEQNAKDVFFDYDKYTLRSQDASSVDQDAAFLSKHPEMNVVIEGHCDERGSEEYNIALGQNRAESLQKALVNDGVAASRIRVISYGKERPFCTDSNEQCWQQNRRDHLKLDQ